MRRWTRMFATVVIAGGMLVTSAASGSAATTGSVKGVIKDRNTGLPLAGACAYVIANGTFMLSAPTGANGRYSIAHVPSGAWEMFAEDCANNVVSYVPQVYRNVDGFRESDKTPVTINAGTATTGINFALRHGGDVAVTAHDKHGNPLANIYLCPLFTDVNTPQSTCRLTDSTGVALLRGELVGSVKIYAYATAQWASQYYRNQPDFANATPVRVKLAQTTAITMVMHPFTA